VWHSAILHPELPLQFGSGARDVEFGSRRGPLHPDLAIWSSELAIQSSDPGMAAAPGAR
jgi:hypothetical protein